MGTNFHTAYADDVTQFTASDMNNPLTTLDRVISYLFNRILNCDGDITWAAGTLTWAGTLRIFFNRTDGQCIQNTVVAGSIAIADNEYAYIDLSETNNAAVSVAKAAVSTGAASNMLTFNRMVLGYRNTTADTFYPVGIRTKM